MKKSIWIIFLLAVLSIQWCFAADRDIRLLVRGDDIGSTHAANMGCIQAFRFGIVRSVELMVPVPWFMEAVRLLQQNPQLDVGIHLTLTSEWSNLKWRPVRQVPSIVDTNGYFYPLVWPNKNSPEGSSLYETEWKLEEMETELRAQIELALTHLPRISHLTDHMGLSSLDAEIEKLIHNLGKEYGLAVNRGNRTVRRLNGWGDDAQTLQQAIDSFQSTLQHLAPGTYLFVCHPAKDVAEMRALLHPPDSSITRQRHWVTQVMTDKTIMQTIRNKNIGLISYKDLYDMK